jgi:hypothetical protein
VPDKFIVDYASLRRRRRPLRRRLAIKFTGRGFAWGLWLGFLVCAWTGPRPFTTALIMLSGFISIIIGDRVLKDRRSKTKST